MAESAQFQAWVDRGALLSTEKQLHLLDVAGDHERWDMDLETCTLTLTVHGRELVCEAQLLGSSAPGPGSWLWGWANDGVPEAAVTAARSLREFGQREAIAEFTSAELPLGEAGNDPPTAFWFRLAVACAALFPDLDCYYRAPIGGGTIAPILLRHPELTLPAPTWPRVVTVLGETFSTIEVSNHRDAVVAYAQERQIPIQQTQGGLALTLPEGVCELEFDDLNRLVSVGGTAGA